METQVLLTIKDRHYDKKKLDSEVRNIRSMLPYIESFTAFCDNNEVFDVDKHIVIKNQNRLLDMYEHGFGINAFICIMSKN